MGMVDMDLGMVDMDMGGVDIQIIIIVLVESWRPDRGRLPRCANKRLVMEHIQEDMDIGGKNIFSLFLLSSDSLIHCLFLPSLSLFAFHSFTSLVID